MDILKLIGGFYLVKGTLNVLGSLIEYETTAISQSQHYQPEIRTQGVDLSDTKGWVSAHNK